MRRVGSKRLVAVWGLGMASLAYAGCSRPVNDPPELTALALNPTFVENGVAVSGFGGTHIDLIEAADRVESLSLTVAGLANGSDEWLLVDGTLVMLTNGTNLTTATNGFDVSVSVAGDTATLTVSQPDGTSVAEAQSLIDGVAYRNTSEEPLGASRTLTLTSIVDTDTTDNGGTDTTALSIASMVSIVAVNDAPVASAVAADPSFLENGPAVSLYSGASIDLTEAADQVASLSLTLVGLGNGADEVLVVDGTSVTLTDGNMATTAARGFDVSVSVAGDTATLTATQPGGTSVADAQALIDSLAYQNTSEEVLGATRVVTVASVEDTGGTANGGISTTVLSIVSTVSSLSLHFSLPVANQLSEGSVLAFDLHFAAGSRPETFVVSVDGEPVAVSGVAWEQGRVTGTLQETLPSGLHVLHASVEVEANGSAAYTDQAITQVEIAVFEDADDCEVLNQVECLLPYPSDRFLESVETEAGTVRRLRLPQVGMPVLNGPPLSTEPLEDFDGFSPGSQVLMHFPAGVDLQASGAPVLLEPGCCGQLDRTPYERVRTIDDTSLRADSPTVLLDVDTGERVPHFLELDAHAEGVERQVVFLRPAMSLGPGHEFIVAVRGLVDPSGEPVSAEPAFRALRDDRPSTVAAVEARRGECEEIFDELASSGVQREDLILALRFQVRSDQQLTQHLLRMRDLVFEYHDDPVNPFTIELDDAFNQQPSNYRPDCQAEGDWIWRQVRGTFETPFFLTPFYGPGTSYFGAQALSEGAEGLPEIQGIHSVPFDILIPCAALDAQREIPPILIGHGLFGTGRGMVNSLIDLGDFTQSSGIGAFDYILGATDWRGLASPDRGFVAAGIIGGSEHKLNEFPKLVARLRQGLTDTAMLARAMKQGWFNAFEPFQRVPGNASTGVFPGVEAEQYYYGISLGGILGATVGAVSPDLDRMNLDVGASNFSVLLDRSTQFSDFEVLLRNLGLTDPMEKAIGQSLLGEQWVGADPEGYIRHLTGLVDPPLPGANAKKVLLTIAWLDKQVSNEVSEITARSLGLPNVSGSLVRSLVGIEDVESGAESGMVVYDIGSFDVFDPAYDAVIPALANLIPDTVCDPHSARVRIPASLQQLLTFLQPGGTIQNFCTDDGVCNASEAFERPDGAETVCNPL